MTKNQVAAEAAELRTMLEEGVDEIAENLAHYDQGDLATQVLRHGRGLVTNTEDAKRAVVLADAMDGILGLNADRIQLLAVGLLLNTVAERVSNPELSLGNLGASESAALVALVLGQQDDGDVGEQDSMTDSQEDDVIFNDEDEDTPEDDVSDDPWDQDEEVPGLGDEEVAGAVEEVSMEPGGMEEHERTFDETPLTPDEQAKRDRAEAVERGLLNRMTAGSAKPTTV